MATLAGLYDLENLVDVQGRVEREMAREARRREREGPNESETDEAEAQIDRGVFPTERFPSPPTDGLWAVRTGNHANPLASAPAPGTEFAPPLMPLTYPPPRPLDASDPNWLATMAADVQRHRAYLHSALARAREEASAAIVEATLVQAELSKEERQMEGFLQRVSNVAGRKFVKRLKQQVANDIQKATKKDEKGKGVERFKGDESEDESESDDDDDQVGRESYRRESDESSEHSGLDKEEVGELIDEDRGEGDDGDDDEGNEVDQLVDDDSDDGGDDDDDDANDGGDNGDEYPDVAPSQPPARFSLFGGKAPPSHAGPPSVDNSAAREASATADLSNLVGATPLSQPTTESSRIASSGPSRSPDSTAGPSYTQADVVNAPIAQRVTTTTAPVASYATRITSEISSSIPEVYAPTHVEPTRSSFNNANAVPGPSRQNNPSRPSNANATAGPSNYTSNTNATAGPSRGRPLRRHDHTLRCDDDFDKPYPPLRYSSEEEEGEESYEDRGSPRPRYVRNSQPEAPGSHFWDSSSEFVPVLPPHIIPPGRTVLRDPVQTVPHHAFSRAQDDMGLSVRQPRSVGPLNRQEGINSEPEDSSTLRRKREFALDEDSDSARERVLKRARMAAGAAEPIPPVVQQPLNEEAMHAAFLRKRRREEMEDQMDDDEFYGRGEFAYNGRGRAGPQPEEEEEGEEQLEGSGRVVFFCPEPDSDPDDEEDKKEVKGKEKAQMSDNPKGKGKQKACEPDEDDNDADDEEDADIRPAKRARTSWFSWFRGSSPSRPVAEASSSASAYTSREGPSHRNKEPQQRSGWGLSLGPASWLGGPSASTSQVQPRARSPSPELQYPEDVEIDDDAEEEPEQPPVRRSRRLGGRR
ncbi:hypothetical protein BJ138DRAFT_1105578 [Hygrophoropsis aurantiaca]|uniref:Uncharacterized protein n=1 Tax=Hygrophoropsis aurantiaca TaxID=72124 RepID=A0ACB7ZYW6_9AGAM|nr:hypothetical protein BJ138DRAFT_1105578 [Hygrophoropsis aurantiaca]